MALIYWLIALGIALILLRKFIRAITLPDSFFKGKNDDEEDENDKSEPIEYDNWGHPVRDNRA